MATATCSLLPTSRVQVVNRCPQPGGELDEAFGEARRVGNEDSAKLPVRLGPVWLSCLPQVWRDYWVVDLDAAYQLAVVSEPRREFLWVLSREPGLLSADWASLNARLIQWQSGPCRTCSSWRFSGSDR